MGQISIIKNISGTQPTLSPDNYFVLSASTNTEYKFRYVYELIMFNKIVFTGKCSPNPQGLGIIPVGDIIHTYASNPPICYVANNTGGTQNYIHQTAYYSTPVNDEVIEWWCYFGEEHSLSANTEVLQFTGIGTGQGDPSFPSGAQRSFLGTMGRNLYSNLPSLDTDKFFMTGYDNLFPSQQSLFLTNSPRVRDIGSNEYFTLSALNYQLPSENVGNYSYVYATEYNFYDNDGLYITGYTIDNIRDNGGGPRYSCSETYQVYSPETGETPSQWNIIHIGAGTNNIFIPSGTSYYTLQLLGGGVVPSGTPTATPTPTPTPSALPAGYTSWKMVNCCNPSQSLIYGIQSGFTGSIRVIGGSCYYALEPQVGASQTIAGGSAYANCFGCISANPCAATPTKGADTTPTTTPTYTSTEPNRGVCPDWVYSSEIFRFNIVDDCDDYDTKQFMFKNRYGTWDYYKFNKKKIEVVEIGRERYSQFDIDYGTSNPVKQPYNRGLTDYATTIREIHTYNSGFINESDMYYLEELATSNDVYILLDTGVPFPINILNTEFEKKTKGRGKEITNLTIQFEFSNNIKLLNK